LRPFYCSVVDYLKNDDADFVYSALNIDNSSEQSLSRLRFLYKHIKENHQNTPGNIYEFGVFRGASLLSTALLLKRLGSSKIVYGFDSFKGFPKYHQNDAIEKFESPLFSDDIRRRVKFLAEISSQLFKKELATSNASGSGDFSGTSYEGLLDKIKALGLDNIELIKGNFEETVPKFFSKTQQHREVFVANLDCDLYEGYRVVLPIVWSNLARNGYIHLDEFYSLKFPGAKLASEEFFRVNGITPKKHLNVRPGEFERWYLTKEVMI